mmetsp:Transcript_16047/g.23543  ORF Transcript_16047/g.23543 Transcript_16047/m.23543 type:complete len:97 (-) Transcript_16047:850-1140(-)
MWHTLNGFIHSTAPNSVQSQFINDKIQQADSEGSSKLPSIYKDIISMPLASRQLQTYTSCKLWLKTYSLASGSPLDTQMNTQQSIREFLTSLESVG